MFLLDKNMYSIQLIMIVGSMLYLIEYYYEYYNK